MTQPEQASFFKPPVDFVRQANISGMGSYQSLCAEADQDYPAFWARLAREHISWQTPFTEILDDSNAPFFKWFADGRLNAAYNCLDRHVQAGLGQKVAIIFESENGGVDTVTYADLLDRVCQFANGLKSLGIEKGSRVVIYMPMSIEVVTAMLACARIGAIHSVVFAGFSAQAVRDRIHDAGAVAVITADQQYRGGKIQELKATVDEALGLGGCHSVRHVIVFQRTGGDCKMLSGRDICWDELIEGKAHECEPEWVAAEHPLFLLYTSGSTGKPKGVQHSTGGYLVQAAVSTQWTFDLKPDDVFWCTADIGWITGHTYITYGPLACGATQLIYEGIPTYPDAGRFWKMIQEHHVSIFYTSPTVIRSLAVAADMNPAVAPSQFDLSSLRVLGTVGEPISPAAWLWFYEKIGGENCPIVDTFWQTETGGHVITPLPGATPLVPGSCTLPFPGIEAAVVDEKGVEVEPGTEGMLVLKRPWPGMIRDIWGDSDLVKAAYYPEDLGGKYYLAGDSAIRDPVTGYFTITGRIDDVLNVSGHRMGTIEIESALASHPKVAEAAVVGRPDDLTGEAICAFVILKGGARPGGEEAAKMAAVLQEHVGREIGPIAKPKDFRFVESLPKTRSGKIMRRLLRSLAKGETVAQDVSTLENPAVLAELWG